MKERSLQGKDWRTNTFGQCACLRGHIYSYLKNSNSHIERMMGRKSFGEIKENKQVIQVEQSAMESVWAAKTDPIIAI